MNMWLSEPFEYPDRPLRRGKVLSAADLERLGQFERYRDVDGDGVCYRTVPGTEHPLAAYFTRGTGHNEKSGYSERPEDWKRNMDRLARKMETARQNLPAPVIEEDAGASVGLIAYGSTHWSMVEARDILREHGLPTGYCRVRALPVSDEVVSFIARHDRVYVVEQNRDGQVCGLLRSVLEGDLDDRLVPVNHYNGTPIAAENIYRPILEREQGTSGNGSLHNGSETSEAESSQGSEMTAE
jgi:2-oxoglutarate ferredoxin oxidoreductase subunit alpha